MVYCLIKRIPNSFIDKRERVQRFITVMGTNTFTVYYLHWIFGYTLLKYFRIDTSGIVINFVKAFVMVVVFSYVGQLLKKVPIIKKLII